MSTDSQKRAAAEHLDSLSAQETRSWLVEALHRRQSLPLLSADEACYLGVLRLEPLLSKASRRDLASACLQLIYEFVQAGHADPDYLNSLLRLTVHFGLDELAAPLAKLAVSFPQQTKLPISSRKLVLATLVDLKLPQPQTFWISLLAQDASAYGGMVVSGLLATKPSAAVEVLPMLPDNQPLADAVAIVLEQTANQLPVRDRAGLIAQVQAVLPRCRSLLAASVKEWLAEIGGLASPGKAKAKASVVEPTFRNLDVLRAGLRQFDPSLRPRPASARLCA